MILKYAVTGANGQVGSYLVRYLRERGQIVYELVRSPEKAIDKTFYKFFDLSLLDEIPSLEGIDVLIHAAHFFDTTAKDYEKINREGTQKLFQQAKINQVKHLIYISTVSAHANAMSLYGRTKYHLELFLQKYIRSVTIIRPGLVFNKPLQGIVGAVDKLINKYSLGPLVGRGNQLIYPCFIEDLAQVIFKISLENPTSNLPIIAASDQPITFKQLLKFLAKKRQKKIILLPLPFYGIYCLLKIMEVFKLSFSLRSDSLLGIQYVNTNLDFSETKKIGVKFNTLEI